MLKANHSTSVMSDWCIYIQLTYLLKKEIKMKIVVTSPVSVSKATGRGRVLSDTTLLYISYHLSLVRGCARI